MLHSKQWHYSLHRDFQNCYSTRRDLTRFFKLQFQLQFQLQCYTCTLHYNPENSPSRIQFYIQKTKSSSSTTTTFQRAKRPSFQKRNSTHRRQGDLLEMHPCVLHDIPVTPVTPVIPTTPETFQTFQSFMTFQPFSLSRQFYNAPVSPGNPPHSSILRLECIFYSSIGFHRNSTEYQLGNYKHYKHSFFKEREMLRYWSNKTLFSRIELSLHCVLSSRVANYKNDIQ